MRISFLKLTILIILVGCNRNPKRFDVKSQEFHRKQSHHYYQKFDNENSISDERVEDGSIEVNSPKQTEAVNNISELDTIDKSNDKGMFSGLFNIFSSSDEKIDSLDKVINDCEEKLYTHLDQANSQQGAINSLISERNNLLKQLDSLQANIVQSKRASNRQLVELESNHKKLKSLIEILSREIE